jgi:hypothetical protein
MSFKWLRNDPSSITDAKLAITGNFNAEDLATKTTPITIPGTGALTVITNDALGSLTTDANGTPDITPLYDPSGSCFDFSQLSMGDQVYIRTDVVVETTTPNTDIDLVLVAGIGIFPFELAWESDAFKTVGVHNIIRTSFITMDTATLLDGTAQFQLRADNACEVTVNGWNYIVNLRS